MMAICILITSSFELAGGSARMGNRCPASGEQKKKTNADPSKAGTLTEMAKRLLSPKADTRKKLEQRNDFPKATTARTRY